MKKLASLFGGILIFLLGAAICTVLALFVLGAFCVSYPVLRLKPRDAKLKAIMDLVLAVGTAVAVLKPADLEKALAALPPDEDEPAPNDT